MNSTNTANTLTAVAASKVVCVGRNYADHAKELGNAVPTSPILFIKPPSAIASVQTGIDIIAVTQSGALGELHFECELCVRMGKQLRHATADDAKTAIDAVTLGLDLTLRDVQNTLKAKGHPWERAKAFDGACVLGEWLPAAVVADYACASYQLDLNGCQQQRGDTSLMLFGVFDLLADISRQFTLEVGDVVMTGTPKGVGALHKGDVLDMSLKTTSGEASWQAQVV